MADYPSAIPTIAANKGSRTRRSIGTPTGGETGDHSGHHNQLARELVAALLELGVNPSGPDSTVAARLARFEELVNLATGPQGIAGDVFGVDVWNSGGHATEAEREAEDDWGPIESNLLANGASKLLFRDKLFPYLTLPVIPPGSHSIMQEGMSNAVWASVGQPRTRKVWRGGGSESPWKTGVSSGVSYSNMGLMYENIGDPFTGFVYLSRSCARSRLENCQVGALNPATTQTAKAGVMLNSIGPIARDFVVQGARAAVQWQEPGFASAINESLVENVEADYITEAFFRNIGTNARIIHPILQYDHSPAGVAGFDSDFDCYSRFYVEMPGNWDPTGIGTGQLIMRQPAGSEWDVSIFFGYNWQGFDDRMFQFDGTGKVRILGDEFVGTQPNTIIDLGAAATALKQLVSIQGLSGQLDEDPIARVAGHKVVEIGPNHERVATRDVRTRFGQRRSGYKYAPPRPTLTSHAGQVGFAESAADGEDEEGVMLIQIGAAPTILGTPLADFRFAWPRDPYPVAGQLPSQRTPLIQIEPFDFGGAGASGGAWKAADIRPQVNSGQVDGFQLIADNVIPANTRISAAYSIGFR